MISRRSWARWNGWQRCVRRWARPSGASTIDTARKNGATNRREAIKGRICKGNLPTRFPIIETGNLDYQTRDMVALVARMLIQDVPVDVYVTHLFMSRGNESLRLFQVQQLLAWIDSRGDVAGAIVCGDFNAGLDAPSAALMATRFRPTQLAPTAFTALTDIDGTVSHPYWPRMDRCIDYVWVAGAIDLIASGVCFNEPSPADPTLWPSDHAGVCADLDIGAMRG